MGKSKANPGQTVRWKTKISEGTNRVTQIVKYPGTPAVYNLDNGLGVKARDIVEVVKNVYNLNILAAMLAVTNMGQPMPPTKEITRLLSVMPSDPVNGVSLGGAVSNLADRYMETNEHERMFMMEARSFIKDLKDEARCRKVWPDIFKRYDEALAAL